MFQNDAERGEYCAPVRARRGNPMLGYRLNGFKCWLYSNLTTRRLDELRLTAELFEKRFACRLAIELHKL